MDLKNYYYLNKEGTKDYNNNYLINPIQKLSSIKPNVGETVAKTTSPTPSSKECNFKKGDIVGDRECSKTYENRQNICQFGKEHSSNLYGLNKDGKTYSKCKLDNGNCVVDYVCSNQPDTPAPAPTPPPTPTVLFILLPGLTA